MQESEDGFQNLLPRIRILTVFAFWWEELEHVVYADTAKTIRCLHVISRIIEDATFASSSDLAEISSAITTAGAGTSHSGIDKSLKEEFAIVCNRLVKVVIEDFADVAYSVFQLATNASDQNFLKAVTRFLVAFKNACVKTSEDFYAIFQPPNLESFMQSFLQHESDIIAARTAYISGELIEDMDCDSPIPINDFITSSIQKFKQAFEQSMQSVNDVSNLITRLFQRTLYLLNSEVSIPTPEVVNNPDSQQNQTNVSTWTESWFSDDCEDLTCLEYHLSIAIGHLRLLGSVADYTETLPPIVETSFVSTCLRSLEFPLFDLQSVALSWFGSAMAHKKIASEFIEHDGMQKLMHFMQNQDHPEYHETKAQHVSFITVALGKHSQVMDQLIQEDTVTGLVEFGLQLLQEPSLDTQLNIIEWFGDCFGHPFMLAAVNQTTVLSIMLMKIEILLAEAEYSQQTEQMMLLNQSLRREAIRSILKYLVFNLHYSILYTKKLEKDERVMIKELQQPNPHHLHNNRANTTRRESSEGAWLHQPESFQQSSRQEFSWLGAINMIRLDEAAVAQLELYVIQYMIDHGGLPKGMKIDLFHAFENDQTSHPLLLSGMIRDDDTISLASTVKKSNTEWITAKLFVKYNVIPILLKALLFESKDSSMYGLALSILELLCLDYTMILEIQLCQVAPSLPAAMATSSSSTMLQLTSNSNATVNQLKKGIEILLATISQDSRKDPSIVTAALRVLSAMSTPPHYRYKGNNVNKAKQLLSDVMFRPNPNNPSTSNSATAATLTTTAVASSHKKGVVGASNKKTPAGGVMGGGLTTIHGKLEQIQKGVRTAIRSYSGITHLVQLIHYKKNQFYVITIRLETIKVLIGIAHDNEIKLILTKMRIPIILENQVKLDQSNEIEGNTAAAVVVMKTIDKELLVLYSDCLIKLLTKSMMEGVTDENVDASQELLDRKAIVEHSHIEFQEMELMYLIKDHLLSKGLVQTVEVLEKELGEPLGNSQWRFLPSIHADEKCSMPSLMPPKTPHAVVTTTDSVPSSQSESRKRPLEVSSEVNELSQRSVESIVKKDSQDRPVNSQESVKRARRSLSPFPLVTINLESISHQPTVPVSTTSSHKPHPFETSTEEFKIVPLVPRSIRRKNIIRAFKQSPDSSCLSITMLPPTPKQPTTTDPQAPSRFCLPPATQSTEISRQNSLATVSPRLGPSSPTINNTPLNPSKRQFLPPLSASQKVTYHYPAPAVNKSGATTNKASSVLSKLSSIMHRYLKLQHQQCKHPITTLPVLSLQKPHVCPKPAYLSSNTKYTTRNMYTTTARRFAYSNTAWYNLYYRKHDYQQQLTYLYSHYRNIKSFRELESPSAMTAMAFAKQLNYLYIGFNDYTMEEDPGIALVNILTGETNVSGHNELRGTIMNIQLSPHENVLFTSVSPGLFEVNQLETVTEHDLYLWRDSNDVTIFDSPYLQHYRVVQPGELNSIMATRGVIPNHYLTKLDYFHAECFDPFHHNRFAALKIDDFLHQSHQHGQSSNTNNNVTNNGGSNTVSNQSFPPPIVSYDQRYQSTSYIFDLETGQIIDRLYNDGNSDTYSVPKIAYHPHHPHLYFMDGKLWDLRINQIIHKFDKLSNFGNTTIHPWKAEVIIDHAIWDLRTYSLIQMIPLLENCVLTFHPQENVLFANHAIVDDEALLEKLFHLPSSRNLSTLNNSSNSGNYFHVFHANEYQHLHTEYLEKEYFQLMSLAIDPFSHGYLSTLLFNMHDMNDSIVRIYEIGKKRKVLGEDSDDDAEDDEDDSEADDEDWRNLSSGEDDDDEEDLDDLQEEDSLSDEDDEDDEDVMSEEEDEEGDSEGDENSEGNEDDEEESYERGEEEEEEVDDEDIDMVLSLASNPINSRRQTRSGLRRSERIRSSRQQSQQEREEEEPEGDDEGWETVSEEEGDDSQREASDEEQEEY